MRKSLFPVLGIFFLFTSISWAQNSDVSAERCCPRSGDKSTHSEVATSIRFDGMYVGRYLDNNLYLRFFEDGEVYGVNLVGTKTMSDLRRRWDTTPRSTYSVNGDKFTVRFVHPNGDVYIGEGIIDGNTLSVDFNGHPFVYTFVPPKISSADVPGIPIRRSKDLFPNDQPSTTNHHSKLSTRPFSCYLSLISVTRASPAT